MSTAGDQASPQRSDAAVKNRRPTMNTRRRPSRSAARPPSSSRPAKRERVGAQHPLQALLGEAEVGFDRGQRHDHDRSVEDDHEEGTAEERERPPAAGIENGRGRQLPDGGGRFPQEPPPSPACVRRRRAAWGGRRSGLCGAIGPLERPGMRISPSPDPPVSAVCVLVAIAGDVRFAVAARPDPGSVQLPVSPRLGTRFGGVAAARA